MEMDRWDRFAHTGDIRDYLAYKHAEQGAGKVGKRHEQPDLCGNRDRFVCRTRRGI